MPTHRLIITTLACMAFVPLCVQAQALQAIYKHVDEDGRVTYSNSPIKGAARVALQPITVLPSSPSGATGSVAVARVTTVPHTTRAVSVAAVNASPATTAKPTATNAVLTAAVPAEAGISKNSAAAATTAAPTESVSTPSQGREDELRYRNLQKSLLAEQESLATAKASLAEEARNSESIRALRASFGAPPDKAGIKKLITTEQREQVEHHFERVRDLQDEIAMHEKNVAGLHAQLSERSSLAGVVATR